MWYALGFLAYRACTLNCVLKRIGCLRFQPGSGHSCDCRRIGENQDNITAHPISCITLAGETAHVPTIYRRRKTHTPTTVRFFPEPLVRSGLNATVFQRILCVGGRLSPIGSHPNTTIHPLLFHTDAAHPRQNGCRCRGGTIEAANRGLSEPANRIPSWWYVCVCAFLEITKDRTREGHFVPAQKQWRDFFRAWILDPAVEIPSPMIPVPGKQDP